MQNENSNFNANNEKLNEKELTLETLMAFIIILLYNVVPMLFETYKFHYIHESGLCMLSGLIITITLGFFYSTNFTEIVQFDDRLFFIFILPPIIFAAGYNLRKRSFFKYFFFIIVFGVIGTLISFLVIVPLTYYFNTLELFTEYSSGNIVNLSVKEILLFASVICATDTIAALTFVKEVTDPKLFAILFGEGVVNDAVCIVLYKIMRDFTETKEEFSSVTTIKMLGSFIKMFILSFIVGSLIGIICSLFLKKLKHINLGRTQETCVIILFAFISYLSAEQLQLSPIIALLVTGIIMSNYAFYNLSFQAREESSIVSRVLSNFAEAFIFTYLGLTFLTHLKNGFSINFILFELVFIIIARFFSIFSLSFVAKNILNMNFKLSCSDQGIMSFAGTIRGAIAFGLVISIGTPNKDMLIGSTLVLVFISTIIFGALMPSVISFFKKFEVYSPERMEKHKRKMSIEEKTFPFLHPNYELENSKTLIKEKKEKKEKRSHPLINYWKRFDDYYIKAMLVYDWPNAKTEHEKLTKKIKKVMAEECQNFRKDSIELSAKDLDFLKDEKEEPFLLHNDSEGYLKNEKVGESQSKINGMNRMDSF